MRSGMDKAEPAYKDPWYLYPLLASYRLWGAAVWWWYGRHKVVGREKVPQTGGLLVLANHLSITDPPFTQFACPRRIFFMANQEVFDWGWAGKFAIWYGAFKVETKSPDRAAIRRAVDLLERGECVCVYPEGGTSPGGIQPLFSGPAMLIRMSGCQVICLGLKNTGQIIPHQQFKAARSRDRIEARWGEPRTFDKSAKADEIMGWVEEQLRALTDEPKPLPDLAEASDSALDQAQEAGTGGVDINGTRPLE